MGNAFATRDHPVSAFNVRLQRFALQRSVNRKIVIERYEQYATGPRSRGEGFFPPRRLRS